MSNVFEEIKQIGIDEGIKEGIEQAMRHSVQAVLSNGKSFQETAKLLKISLEDVRKFSEEPKAEGAKV